MDISKLNVSDAQIFEIVMNSNNLVIFINNWKGEIYKLIFFNIAAIELYSPEGVDISHIKVTSQSEDIQKVCRIIEEDEKLLTEYSFISSWNNQSIINIYGTSVEIYKIEK